MQFTYIVYFSTENIKSENIQIYKYTILTINYKTNHYLMQKEARDR